MINAYYDIEALNEQLHLERKQYAELLRSNRKLQDLRGKRVKIKLLENSLKSLMLNNQGKKN